MSPGCASVRHSRVSRRLLLLAAAVLCGGLRVIAQDTVDITLPPSVTFLLIDVTGDTAGDSNPTTVSFANATFSPEHALRISVAGSFGSLSGQAIPANLVSWTTASAINGVGINGTLSTTGYNTLFEGDEGAVDGSVKVYWLLSAPGTPLGAGNHQLTLRWKLEAFKP